MKTFNMLWSCFKHDFNYSQNTIYYLKHVCGIVYSMKKF